MPRARLPRRPCPHACHAQATRRAHHGTSPAPITLVPAPIMMAAVTLRYPARPLPRYPAQTTVLDSSGPDVGLEWHPHPSAPRHAAAHDSDRLHTCRPGDLAGGPRSPPDTTTTRFSLSAPILSPLRPFLRWPGPALGLSPLHNRDPAVTGPGLARARGKSMHPDRALRAPTQDSDRHPRYSAPRHAVVHGSARPYAHRLGDRDCGSSTTAKYTATWSPIRLTAAVTLRSTARPVPRHSVRTRLFTSRHRTRMEPEPLGATSHRGARLGPALHAQTRRPCRWLLDYCQIHRDMASHRAHGGRDPAVHGPARPSALRPDQTLPAPTQD